MRMMLPVGAAVVVATFGLTAGHALAKNEIQKECASKYQAAKAANQLNGLSYNQYYKQCAAAAKAGGTTPAAAPAPAAPAPTPTAAPAAPAPAPKRTTTKAAVPAAPAGTVFPTAISAEFAKESAGKAREHTCLAQYKANGSKGGAGNGGMVWIQKGGGYYSECNKRLK